jgi:hypothetical protein
MPERRKLKKHHHVVPRTYLRGWADADDKVAVRARGEQDGARRPISHSAVRSRFYNYRDTDDLESDVVEEWLAQHVESPGSHLLRSLRNGADPMDLKHGSLVNLVVAQLVRSPTVFAYMRQIDERIGPVLAMVQACNELGVNPADLDDNARERVYADAKRAWFAQEERDTRASMLRTMMRKLDELSGAVENWHWSVLTAPRPALVTGDTPVATLELNERGGWSGILPEGSPLWLPLSPQRLLVAEPARPLTNDRTLKPEMAVLVNRSLARQADQALFNHPDLPWPDGAELASSKPTLPTPTLTWSRQNGRPPTFPATFPEIRQSSVRAVLDAMGAQDIVE